MVQLEPVTTKGHPENGPCYMIMLIVESDDILVTPFVPHIYVLIIKGIKMWN